MHPGHPGGCPDGSPPCLHLKSSSTQELAKLRQRVRCLASRARGEEGNHDLQRARVAQGAFFPDFFRRRSDEKASLKPHPLTAVLCAPQVECAERAERAALILADTAFELRDERRHLDAHGLGRAPRHLHHRRGDPRAPEGRLLRQEAGARAAECREPPRASRTRPDAAALCSCSQDVLNRTVCCIFP